jgi:hypothetical protein
MLRFPVPSMVPPTPPLRRAGAKALCRSAFDAGRGKADDLVRDAATTGSAESGHVAECRNEFAPVDTAHSITGALTARSSQ